MSAAEHRQTEEDVGGRRRKYDHRYVSFSFPGAGDKTLAIDRDKENEGDATDSEISMMSAEGGIIR